MAKVIEVECETCEAMSVQPGTCDKCIDTGRAEMAGREVPPPPPKKVYVPNPRRKPRFTWDYMPAVDARALGPLALEEKLGKAALGVDTLKTDDLKMDRALRTDLDLKIDRVLKIDRPSTLDLYDAHLKGLERMFDAPETKGDAFLRNLDRLDRMFE